MGETFGFGFLPGRRGLSGAFLFDAERAGIDDRVSLQLPRGQIISADCVFSRHGTLVHVQRPGRR